MIRSYGVLIASFMVSAQVAFAGELNPKVVVTTPPLKPYTDALLRGIGESYSLLRPGQDAHTFTLSPSQRRALSTADVIIIPDRTMNPVLDTMLAMEEKRGAKVLALTDLREARALPYPKKNPWLDLAGEADHTDDEADDDARDPHVWLDPERMASLALPVAEAIGVAAPSHQARLQQNARDLAFHLREEVTPGVTAILEAVSPKESMSARPQVPFITYHAAYQYFLKRFRLESMGQITQRPENYLGARALHDTVSGAGKLSIRCIVSETNSPLVQRIAKASRARIVILSPEGLYTGDEAGQAPWVRNDYDRLLLKTATSFASCLKE